MSAVQYTAGRRAASSATRSGRYVPSELIRANVPPCCTGVSVVEFQGADIPAEGLLQLGGLLRRPAGHGGDLGIAGVLVHG